MQAKHHHSEDQKIWLQMTQGNGFALVQLYDQHVNSLFSYGKKLTNKSEIIEDAIQDLFTELWSKREKLSFPVSVKAYLLKAFRQKLLRQLSKYKKLGFLEDYSLAIDKHTELEMPEEERPELTVIYKISLERSLATLSTKQREAILLKYSENLSHDEIAEIMEIKKQSLYNLLSEAIQKLSKAMKDQKRSTFVYFIFITFLASVSIAIF